MVETRVVFDDAALDKLFRSPVGPVAKDLKRRSVKVHRRAKHLCPVDTGRLRSSITEEMAGEGGELVARIGTDVVYGPYVEMGTSRMRAQPFLRPALDAAR